MNRAGARGTFRLRAGAITLSLLVTALSAGCGGTASRVVPRTGRPDHHGDRQPHRAPTIPLGSMAGYIFRGDVHSVAASWIVPTILPWSGVGRAGTWIGAQLGTGSRAPFIQVGVNEERLPVPLSKPVDLYYAFWSDTRLGFHPHRLFAVDPATEVSASMTLAGNRWYVMLNDQADRHTATFSTADDAVGRFTLAEWLQEDITDEVHHRPFPFPQLETIAFTGLAVDGQPPASRQMLSQWMSENGANLAPGPFQHDSFELNSDNLTRAGLHYLHIAIPGDIEDQAFLVALVHWSSSTPRAQVAAQTSAFARSIQRSAAGISRYKWPVRARAPIGIWLRQVRPLIALTRDGPSHAGVGLPGWRAAWLAAADTLGRDSIAIRAALNVPDITPQQFR